MHEEACCEDYKCGAVKRLRYHRWRGQRGAVVVARRAPRRHHAAADLAGFPTWPIQRYVVCDGGVGRTTPGEWDPVTSFQIMPIDSRSSHPDMQFSCFLSSSGGSHGTITFGSHEISATPTHRILRTEVPQRVLLPRMSSFGRVREPSSLSPIESPSYVVSCFYRIRFYGVKTRGSQDVFHRMPTVAR